MSWIPVDLLIAREENEQLLLDIDFPPLVYVDERYLESVPVGHNIVSSLGSQFSSISHTDHPYFLQTKKWLLDRGYIEEPGYPCSNGDRVVKPFYFNDVFLKQGETFYCAPAWKYNVKYRRRDFYSPKKELTLSPG
jgi:hypothetical protein